MILTVVVAAYNVENYVGDCLSSVLSQLDDDDPIELIVVVDGATDNTLNAVYELLERAPDPRARVITQPNAGLSGARNTGLAQARGRYVTFLDGDDFWLPGYVRRALQAIHELDPDIIEYNAVVTDELGAAFSHFNIAYSADGLTTVSSRDRFLELFRCYAWARIYRKDLFSQRRFPLGRRFEDAATIPWLYWKASLIVSVGAPLLAYRQRGGSILSCPRPSDIADLNYAANQAFAMYQETSSAYWLEVCLRIFQQSCSRIATLPLKLWPSAIVDARMGLHQLPRRGGAARKLMLTSPLTYTLLLSIKRASYDKYARWKQRISFSRRPDVIVKAEG